MIIAIDATFVFWVAYHFYFSIGSWYEQLKTMFWKMTSCFQCEDGLEFHKGVAITYLMGFPVIWCLFHLTIPRERFLEKLKSLEIPDNMIYAIFVLYEQVFVHVWCLSCLSNCFTRTTIDVKQVTSSWVRIKRNINLFTRLVEVVRSYVYLGVIFNAHLGRFFMT